MNGVTNTLIHLLQPFKNTATTFRHTTTVQCLTCIGLHAFESPRRHFSPSFGFDFRGKLTNLWCTKSPVKRNFFSNPIEFRLADKMAMHLAIFLNTLYMHNNIMQLLLQSGIIQ